MKKIKLCKKIVLTILFMLNFFCLKAQMLKQEIDSLDRSSQKIYQVIFNYLDTEIIKLAKLEEIISRTKIYFLEKNILVLFANSGSLPCFACYEMYLFDYQYNLLDKNMTEDNKTFGDISFKDYTNDKKVEMLYVYPNYSTAGSYAYRVLKIYTFTNSKITKILTETTEVIDFESKNKMYEKTDLYTKGDTLNSKTTYYEISDEVSLKNWDFPLEYYINFSKLATKKSQKLTLSLWMRNTLSYKKL